MNKRLGYLLYVTIILGLNGVSYIGKIDLSMFWLGGVLVLLLVTLRSDNQRPHKLNRFQDELSEQMEAKALGEAKEKKKQTKLKLTGKQCFYLILPLLINCVVVYFWF